MMMMMMMMMMTMMMVMVMMMMMPEGVEPTGGDSGHVSLLQTPLAADFVSLFLGY
jgi:hypothetical protein